MNKKRKDYIGDVVRYGTRAIITIPTTILHEKTIEPDSFKVLRESLEVLQNDEELIVTLEDLEDDLTDVIIEIRPENDIEE